MEIVRRYSSGHCSLIFVLLSRRSEAWYACIYSKPVLLHLRRRHREIAPASQSRTTFFSPLPLRFDFLWSAWTRNPRILGPTLKLTACASGRGPQCLGLSVGYPIPVKPSKLCRHPVLPRLRCLFSRRKAHITQLEA
ncbi:hypothetical protein FB451DRAFT_156777 [Mycena latifolia]|nr:hypothetical protein FB451DRAFT_156777 [Mycena latifolia]